MAAESKKEPDMESDADRVGEAERVKGCLGCTLRYHYTVAVVAQGSSKIQNGIRHQGEIHGAEAPREELTWQDARALIVCLGSSNGV